MAGEAGASNVGLQLSVTLDLAAFRKQLGLAAQAAAAYYYPINVFIDKRNFDRQLDNIDRQFARRNYRLEVITNFAAEIDYADKLITKIQQVKQAANGGQTAGKVPPVGLVNASNLNLTKKDQGVSVGEIKALYESLAIAGVEGFERGSKKTRLQMIAQIQTVGQDVMAGLLNGLGSGDAALEAAAKNLGTVLITTFKRLLGIASPSRVFRELGRNIGEGFEQGVIASMDKAFDALERQLRQRLAVLQGMMSGGRGAFPFVAKTGPIEQKALFAESANLARKIDQTRAEISQIQARRESRMSLQRESLAQSAGRILPPARDRSLPAARGAIFPQDTATEQVLQGFFRSLRNAQDFFARNFSANTYLSKASYQFATSMNEASRLLREQRIAGLLPSLEMLEPLKFQRAIQAAQKIDAANAFKGLLSTPLLPGVGMTGSTAAARATLSGQQFRAPSLGRTEAGQPGAAMAESGPIADRLRQAAVNFSKNAPSVIKYLNLFSTAGGINIGDLPGPGESPGQYIRRIQQSLQLQLKQGGFGAGTVPSRTEFFQPGRGPQLPGMPIQPLLPPGGGTGGGDRVRGVEPDRGGALALAKSPSTDLPKNYFENAKKYSAALGMARATMDKFSAAQVPFIGGLQGLAAEFGMATKQVLLYGTAYKGLAFVTSLPGQLLNAAKGQQQYNNALKTATQDTGTYAKELLYVDGVQRAFGLDLEITRQGFARLYASMGPAGFDSGSIEKLFTGISAATAALQLTPDKAERVIYAFGQMASKGQIMSEELKGQLGDVLPGALAIFAKAAGMSVKEFNKAMEDGEFVGKRFREVFAQVSDQLMTRFGTGAQAAGRSLQGLLNTVRGEFLRTLEALSPLADAAAKAVLAPLGEGLKTMAVGAQIATGEMGRVAKQVQEAQQVVADLKKQNADQKDIDAASQSLVALEARLRSLQLASTDPAIMDAAKNIDAFTKELAKAGQFVMTVAQGIGRVLGPAVALLGGNFTTLVTSAVLVYGAFQTLRLSVLAVVGVFKLLDIASQVVGMSKAAQSAGALALALQSVGIQATTAQAGMVGFRAAIIAVAGATGIGLLLVGLGALITHLMNVGAAADESKRRLSSAIIEAKRLAVEGQVMPLEARIAEIKRVEAADKQAIALYQQLEGKRRLARENALPLTEEQVDILGASKLTEEALGGRPGARTFESRGNLARKFAEESALRAEELRKFERQVPEARRQAQRMGLNVPTPGQLPPDELDAKADAARVRAAENARKLADDQRKYEADLMKMGAEQAMALDDMTFSHWKDLQKAKYDLLEAGQNEWMSREIKFQRDLQAIEIRRMEAVRAVRAETQKAEIEAQSRAYIAGGKTGATGLLQGSTGVSSGPHFDVRRADGTRISEAEARALFDESVRKRLQMTSGYGPRNTGIPGASTFHRGIDLAGPANTPLNLAPGYSMLSAGMEGGLGYTANIQGPQGQRYKVGHLQQPQGGAPASRVRAEQRKDNNEALAMQAAVNAKERESLGIKQANAMAQQEINILIKEYVASMIPVEQQKLENSLMQDRINLMSSGVLGEALNTEIAINKAKRQTALGIAESEKIIADNAELVKKGGKEAERAANNIAFQRQKIDEAKKALENYLPLLREQLQLQQQQAEMELRGSIQRATPLGGTGLSGGFIGEAASRYEEALGRGASQQDATRFAELQNQLTMLETRNNAVRSSILAIGDAFGTAMTAGVASLVDGTASAQEVFANFLKGVGEALLQAAQQMIATYIAIGIARIFAGLGSSLGGANANLSGTGALASPVSGLSVGGASAVTSYAPSAVSTSFAGAAFPASSFTPFANGGIVNGPTLSLMGEGKYNEAIVPLPDGRSIPVQLRGFSQGSRDLIGSSGSSAGSPVLNMSFETTTINGVEYVSRDQLEQAMMETRKNAAREGAARGASLAIDKLQQSPSTRRKVGLA
jgi:tape measure domain-containing protein